MLDIAKRKLAKSNLNDKITLLKKDITQLELPDNSIDMVTISFGIRNIPDFQFIIAEIYRILKTNGVLIILEFSLPENRIIKKIYLFYK